MHDVLDLFGRVAKRAGEVHSSDFSNIQIFRIIIFIVLFLFQHSYIQQHGEGKILHTNGNYHLFVCWTNISCNIWLYVCV